MCAFNNLIADFLLLQCSESILHELDPTRSEAAEENISPMIVAGGYAAPALHTTEGFLYAAMLAIKTLVEVTGFLRLL